MATHQVPTVATAEVLVQAYSLPDLPLLNTTYPVPVVEATKLKPPAHRNTATKHATADLSNPSLQYKPRTHEQKIVLQWDCQARWELLWCES